jgi:hypothetical protein
MANKLLHVTRMSLGEQPRQFGAEVQTEAPDLLIRLISHSVTTIASSHIQSITTIIKHK